MKTVARRRSFRPQLESLDDRIVPDAMICQVEAALPPPSMPRLDIRILSVPELFICFPGDAHALQGAAPQDEQPTGPSPNQAPDVVLETGKPDQGAANAAPPRTTVSSAPDVRVTWTSESGK